MNAPTPATMINLNTLFKSELVEMTRILTGTVGDTARLDKKHYLDTVSGFSLADQVEALGKLKGSLNAVSILNGLNVNVPAAAEKAPEPAPVSEPVKAEQKPAGGTDSEAVAQLLGALDKLVKPTLNGDEIAEMVKSEIAKAMANVAPRTETIVVTENKSVNMGDEHMHPMFETVLKLAGLRQNILMVGAAGTGKTTASEQASRALGLPFAAISCTAGMSESQLLGWLLPTGDGGKFEYCESDFVRLYENGGVFLLDEIDAADANVLMLINQALANGGFYIPQRHGNTFCKRHKDFVCIAAANTFGTGADLIYAGREQLDAATLDRYTIVKFDYDAELEKKAVNADLLAWGLALRKAVSSNRLRRIVSTRRLIAMTQQLAAGFTMAEVKDMFFNGWTTDEKIKCGEA